jgi:hypothetical protein
MPATSTPRGSGTTVTATERLPRRLFVVPLAIGLVLVALNLQWLRLYQLQNAPTADALVYLSEAYRDFWLVRDAGPGAVLAKYTSGMQQTAPTVWWCAGVMFLLLGTNPANAYLVLGLAYLVWIGGGVALAWRLRPGDRLFALASGLAVALLPSTVTYGLRTFMLDMAAAAVYVWATVLLLDSDVLRRRRAAIVYGAMCGLTLLVRTASLPFFLAHAAMLAIRRRQWPSYLNGALAVLAGILVAGWFLVPSLPRIYTYYGYWAQAGAGETKKDGSFLHGMWFYGTLLWTFHLSPQVFRVYAPLVLAGLSLAVPSVWRRLPASSAQDDREGLIILIAFLLVPLMMFSLYPSRALWVDFPLAIGYVLLPLVAWRIVVPSTRWFWVPVLALLLPMGSTQLQAVIRSPQLLPSVDWREREALRAIFDDATRRGLSRVRLGSTGIHQHNALGYEYWVLANAFPVWRGRVDVAAIGRTESPAELARMNASADYVVTLENFDGSWHPNNRAAPEASRLLLRQGFRALKPSIALPDGSTLVILAKAVSAGLPPPEADGWHLNGVSVRVVNPGRVGLRLRLRGTLLRGRGERATIELVRLDEMPSGNASNGAPWTGLTTSGPNLDAVIDVPSSVFAASAEATLSLRSSWAHDPASQPAAPERRRLAFRWLTVSTEALP